ncbi:non-structural maintenance of chromosomes protein [Chloropicon primus]|uniref:Non-structural maintenance of chromosomes element 4 n=1 Tax=Chloropicon primus TaxID=1764295 RepID=A0A5B8MZA2_9CHLO|nr:non-structural maintenance of chromosomes protein [Chloropicon primus]UPR04222.1 non-structural maintenance of chromosomes protein [Chloropicon primus]|eukprot:QDZ25015.1 non-structural maintenance of chromosomes protein [Chloropicon primus]
MKDRRKLREKYRELIVLSEENRDSTQWEKPEKLKEILATANELHGHVTKPREHAADTELLSTLAASGLSHAKKSLVWGKRLNTAKDLVNALKCEYLPGWTPKEATADQNLEEFDWEKAGAFASNYLNTVVGVTTMFGPFQDLMPKEARQASRRGPRQKLGEHVNPDELEDAQACCSEQQKTDKNMEEMLNILLDADNLDADGSVKMAELIFNPKSFSQTVENIFTLSFLVKDGRVKVVENTNDGCIMVSAMTRSREGVTQQMGQVQFISSFSMKTWRLMKEKIRESSCLMKHRTAEDLGLEVPESPDDAPPPRRKRASQQSPPRRRAAARRIMLDM